jgi:hypothetical protein|tara:strand:+ start:92 stop:259 length:168 start_codon:yes stop_codon:yes gene_type:complete
MLELIGLIALVYLAIRFMPGILLFAGKVIIVLVGLWLLLSVMVWMFGIPTYIIYL